MSVRYESENVSAEPLGQPLKFEFSGKTASNRFIKGAMTERLSTARPFRVRHNLVSAARQ